MATPKATAPIDAPVENATEPEADLELASAVEVAPEVAVGAVDPVEIAFSVRPAQDGLPAFPL